MINSVYGAPGGTVGGKLTWGALEVMKFLLLSCAVEHGKVDHWIRGP